MPTEQNSTPETPLSKADELAKLAELKKQGVLTEEEFSREKTKLLRTPKSSAADEDEDEDEDNDTETESTAVRKTTTGKNKKEDTKHQVLGCLTIIVIIVLCLKMCGGGGGGGSQADSNSAASYGGFWIKDADLPNAYDRAFVLIEGDRMGAELVFAGGKATVKHSGTIINKKEDDGGNKISMVVPVEVKIDDVVVNKSLDVFLVYKKGADSKQDRLDYLITGKSKDGSQTEPVLLKEFHRQ